MITCIQGQPGAGKSYVAVNKLLASVLTESKRPVFTNLPIVLDKFVASLTKSEVKRQEYRDRITFLELGRKVNVLDPETGELLFEDVDELKHFWYQMTPGAVGVFDELGDVFNAREWKNNPEKLGTYINHHRHYKHDIYLMCQALEDIDSQLRRKIAQLWDIENGRTAPMFKGSKFFAFLKWPIDVFFQDQYQLRHKGSSAERNFLDRQLVFPKAKGFECYESFSKAEGLDGVAHGDVSDLESNDHKSAATKRRENIGNALRVFFLLAFGVLCFGGFIFGVFKLVRGGDEVGQMVGGLSNKGQTGDFETSLAEVTADPLGVAREAIGRTERIQRERVEVVTPLKVKTNLGTYVNGGVINGKRIERILINGWILEQDGRTFRELFTETFSPEPVDGAVE